MLSGNFQESWEVFRFLQRMGWGSVQPSLESGVQEDLQEDWIDHPLNSKVFTFLKQTFFHTLYYSRKCCAVTFMNTRLTVFSRAHPNWLIKAVSW